MLNTTHKQACYREVGAYSQRVVSHFPVLKLSGENEPRTSGSNFKSKTTTTINTKKEESKNDVKGRNCKTLQKTDYLSTLHISVYQNFTS